VGLWLGAARHDKLLDATKRRQDKAHRYVHISWVAEGCFSWTILYGQQRVAVLGDVEERRVIMRAAQAHSHVCVRLTDSLTS